MSRGRIDPARLWSIHYQDAWRDDAANPRLPMPLRVAFLAYGNHRANGHAVFRQGEIAKTLGHLDEDGHPVPADRRSVYRAIRQAIDYGLLDEDSKALCLIVPEHRISQGPGQENELCIRHPKDTRRTGLRAVS